MVELTDPFEDGLLQVYDLSGSELIIPLPIHDETPTISQPDIDIYNPEHLPEGSQEGYRSVDLLFTNWRYDFIHRVLTPDYCDPAAMSMQVILMRDVEPFLKGNALDADALRACTSYRWQLSEDKSLEEAKITAEFLDQPVRQGPSYQYPKNDDDFSELEVDDVIFQRVITGSLRMDLFNVEYYLPISPEHYLLFSLSPTGFLTEDGFGKTKEERQEFVNQVADDVMRQIRFTPSAQLKVQMAESAAA